MALNLSTLTNPATSGDVLAEALTTADFLEGVPVLRNLARGSQKGGDAKQDVALNQPKALPLTADSNGVVGGYLYQPDVTGNAPAVNIPSISANEDFVFEIEVYLVDATSFHLASGADANNRFGIYNNAFYFAPEASGLTSPLSTGASTLTVERSGTTATLKQDGVTKATHTANISDNTYTFTHLSFNGQYGTSIGRINGYIKKATLSIGGTQQLNIDFTATNVRHGDTKFKCATGQVVTINQAGNDPATIIKKPVLRFDGVNDGLQGLFGQTITEGHLFAAFSILGNGGESYARMFIINPTGGTDSGHFLGFRLAETETFRSDTGGSGLNYSNMYNDERGDVLYEYKFKSGDTRMRFNNATGLTSSGTVACSAQEFSIAASEIVAQNNASLDLEYLALFPATITDAQAEDVRNYINNRNNVFSLVDGFGYYFFDAQKAPAVPITSGSSSWNGRIVGSDNGDTNRYLTQGTSNDAPVGNGYTVTFADNSDHLDIPQVTQAGWQVVGTSLGTFAYRVNNTAVTELNLLGNAGSHRSAGDSYGMLLLPDSATGADIEQARKFLIDRGAADSVVFSGYGSVWNNRTDIVEFRHSSFEDATNLVKAFKGQTALNLFSVIQAPNCSNFSQAWQSCSALTSFPAGAKLGTAASNVNFTSAWRDSGLTSFPAGIDLSKATTFTNTWRQSGLTSFPAIQSTQNGTTFLNAWYNCASMTSFGNANLDNGGMFQAAWQSCYNLEDFPALFNNWNPSTITTGVFTVAWDACNKLTAQSVENILTSIDASGKYATTNGASGGTALGDAGIDIDYNTATGSLSAATNAAVTSLKAKGWSIIVNNVTL